MPGMTATKLVGSWLLRTRDGRLCQPAAVDDGRAAVRHPSGKHADVRRTDAAEKRRGRDRSGQPLGGTQRRIEHVEHVVVPQEDDPGKLPLAEDRQRDPAADRLGHHGRPLSGGPLEEDRPALAGSDRDPRTLRAGQADRRPRERRLHRFHHRRAVGHGQSEQDGRSVSRSTTPTAAASAPGTPSVSPTFTKRVPGGAGRPSPTRTNRLPS